MYCIEQIFLSCARSHLLLQHRIILRTDVAVRIALDVGVEAADIAVFAVGAGRLFLLRLEAVRARADIAAEDGPARIAQDVVDVREHELELLRLADVAALPAVAVEIHDRLAIRADDILLLLVLYLAESRLDEGEARIDGLGDIEVGQHPTRHAQLGVDALLELCLRVLLPRLQQRILQERVEDAGRQALLPLLLQELAPDHHVDEQLQPEAVVDLEEVDGDMARLVVEDQVVRRALVQVEAVDLALEREGVAVAERQWLQVDLVVRMAERLLEEGRLESRDGRPGRQMADGLLRRLLDALLEVAVVVAAQQDLALQARRQRVDELLAERGALFFWHILPAIRVVALDDTAVLLEHGVQQLPEVH